MCTALTLVALNGLDLLACNIYNSYLTANFREKIYIISGEDFGSEAVSIMILKMNFYGLKSLGSAFRAKLDQVLYDINYRPSRADPGVGIIPAVKGDGFKYYEYNLCYLDDVLCILHVPLKTIYGIKAVFKLKGGKSEPP